MEELLKIEDGQLRIKAIEQIKKIIEFEKYKAEMEYQEKMLKAELLEKMTELDIKKFITEGLSATIKEGCTRTTIDTKRLKEECPEIYEAYSKTTEVKPSLILTVAD